MLKFLEGKKTYIGAVILALTGMGGYWLDVYDLQTAGLILGAAVTAVGLGGKLQRHIEVTLKFLEAQKRK